MLEQLNQFSLEYIKRYQNLKIYNNSVNTPYSMNVTQLSAIDPLLKLSGLDDAQIKSIRNRYKNREVFYGWYRGKGTPEQLEDAVMKISEQNNISLSAATSYGIAEFMKLYGLGVDCSGFVYNTLSYAFSKLNKFEDFNNSLAWSDPDKQNANYAGDFVFREGASQRITAHELQPLDLFSANQTNHLSMVVKIDGTLYIAQSNIDSVPTGVTLTKLEVVNGKPIFEYKAQIGKDWNLLTPEELEFRRLNILTA